MEARTGPQEYSVMRKYETRLPKRKDSSYLWTFFLFQHKELRPQSFSFLRKEHLRVLRNSIFKQAETCIILAFYLIPYKLELCSVFIIF